LVDDFQGGGSTAAGGEVVRRCESARVRKLGAGSAGGGLGGVGERLRGN
jgi:hypothetical protein